MKLVLKSFLLWLLVAGAMLTSCLKEKEIGPDEVIMLQKISGDNQEGAKNSLLPSPLKVRIVNADGVPKRDFPVIFDIVKGLGATASPFNITTDHDGYAQTSWKLGEQGLQELEAKIGSRFGVNTGQVSPVTFSASFDILHLQKISGDNQQGNALAPLPEKIKVKVVNSDGVPKKYILLKFTSSTGYSPNSNRFYTDSEGYAEFTWYIGHASNTVTLEVTVDTAYGAEFSGVPAVFTAYIN